jgi:nucleotide-binding universal stress UspA family protein
MKTILVPTDFSGISDNAISYAAELAKLTEAKIVLFHVYHVPVITTDVPVVLPTLEELGEDCMEGLKKIESEIYAVHGTGMQIECRCECGLVVDEVEELLKKEKIDLIVLGMHGAGYLSEKLIGSVTTAVIRKVKCPVLAISSDVKFKPIKNIAFACDYKEINDRQLLEPLKEFANLFSAHISIVNVVRETAELIPNTDQAIAGVKLEHSLEGTEHSFHYTQHNDVVEGINHFVTENHIDMVVMIPRMHSVLRNIFHEPQTKRMAFHTHVPLLSLHE